MEQQALAVAFGKAVRRLRTERGFSQEAFAYEAGVHRTSMGLIERGKAVVSIHTAYKVAVALQIELPELMSETMEQANTA